MRPFLERLKSRKFIMALAAAVVAFVKSYYPDFPDDAFYAIIGCLMGFVAVEGMIDAAGTLAKWLNETLNKKKEGDSGADIPK